MGTKNCSEYTTHASVPPSVRPSRDSQCVIHRRQNRIRGSSGRFLPQKSILEVNSNVWPKFVEFGQRNGEGMAGQKARLAFDELAAVAPCCGSWSSCVRVCVCVFTGKQAGNGGGPCHSDRSSNSRTNKRSLAIHRHLVNRPPLHSNSQKCQKRSRQRLHRTAAH